MFFETVRSPEEDRHPDGQVGTSTFLPNDLSNSKKGPWLFRGFVGDEILPSYVGIIINHYKDPY